MAPPLKNLYLANSYQELIAKAVFPIPPCEISAKMLLGSADRLREKAELSLSEGDEELAFFYLHRCEEVIALAEKMEDYKETKSLFQHLLLERYCQQRNATLKELINSLQTRYKESPPGDLPMTSATEKTLTPGSDLVSPSSSGHHHPPLEMHLVETRQLSLNFPQYLGMSSSSPSGRKTEVEVEINLDKISSRLDEFINVIRGSSSCMSISFQIKIINEQTNLVGMIVRVEGPFITKLLNESKTPVKMTFSMRLFGKDKDLLCQDAVMRVLKNEKGQNAWFGLDVGLIALKEWLHHGGDAAAQVPAQLTIRLMGLT